MGFKILLFSQINETFSDGNIIADPKWEGDLDNFVVNSDKQLQLVAPIAGTSFIYTAANVADSFSLEFYINMKFSPSGSNFCKIFLIDQSDISIANGYSFLFGENGSEDAVRFYKQENGQATLLASGTLGKMSPDPSKVAIKLSYRAGGTWTIESDYDGLGIYGDQIFVVENSFSPSSLKNFGIQCVYTSTRTDKFYFDNIILKEFQLDKQAPNLLSASIIDDRTVRLFFDESLDATSAEDRSHYEINNGIGVPILAVFDINKPREVVLDLANPLLASGSYFLNVVGLKDLAGNEIVQSQTVELRFIAKPVLGDILINEILFNPYTEGEDFVEIINVTDKNIDLSGLIIANFEKNEQKSLGNITITPHQILAFTEDRNALISIYEPTLESNIVETDLPAFNNDMGNISLEYNGVVLDSFDYNEDLHLSFLDDVEGVSLERLDILTPSSDLDNWQSASKSVKYATPGYKNSNQIGLVTGDEEFSFINKTFSPYGEIKLMILKYELEESGYLANVSIFDSDGYIIKKIANNELLGKNGIFSWDGTNERGEVQRLGIYIVVGELFNANFSTKYFKKVCVLADFLD